jgi:hypothetical protein
VQKPETPIKTTGPSHDEPHHSKCPAYGSRWCYREECDSDLGCIEVRRAQMIDRQWVPRKLTPAMRETFWINMTRDIEDGKPEAADKCWTAILKAASDV